MIGCGLGTAEAAAGWVREVLASGVPAVLDADALNLLASDREAIARAAGSDRDHAAPRRGGAPARDAAPPRSRPIGSRPRARSPRGRTPSSCSRARARSSATARSATSSARSTRPAARRSRPAAAATCSPGVIGALLAQGLAVGDAARAGVYVHGRAGEHLAHVHGERGVLSSDLPAAIAFVLRSLA